MSKVSFNTVIKYDAELQKLVSRVEHEKELIAPDEELLGLEDS